MSVRALVGLGNPGPRYDGTRHNVGFLILDELARRKGASWKDEPRLRAQTASVILAGNTVLLVKPQTYMNESARSVSAVCRLFKWKPAEVCVAYDEYQLGVGAFKVSQRGGSGGHNGMVSLIGSMGEDFVRYRIGIGPAEKPQVTLSEFVLGQFTPEESKKLEAAIDCLIEGLIHLVAVGPLEAMNSLNKRRKPTHTHNEPNGNTSLSGDGDL